MDIKHFKANILPHLKPLTEYDKIALNSKSAVSVTNGEIRWLEENQVFQFEEPMSLSNNIEFTVVGRPFQKIWFSQLSSYGIDAKSHSLLLDEIVFKGQDPCVISKRYKSAIDFWKAVRGKNFKVEIIGTGYDLNGKDAIVDLIRKSSGEWTSISNEIVDKSILDFIQQKVNEGKTSEVLGTLKNKTAYRLIEI